MKNILYAFLLVFCLSSCDRELEFSSDFEFKINNIDDTEIIINNLKSFQLEILSTKNIIKNKNYKFSYSILSGSLSIKDGSNTLIEDDQYNYTADDLNQINLDYIPQSSGQIKVRFSLTDNNGVEKTKDIIIYCTENDFSYIFTGNLPNPNGLVNVGIPFNLNVTNTGQSANQFQLKYISTGVSSITINGNVVQPNQYFNITAGTIQGLLSSPNVGSHSVTFTCLDANGQEQQVNLTFIITAPPFSLVKVSDFSVKNTLQKEFKFSLTNTLSSATYQIKFNTQNPAKVILGTTIINLNTWNNLTLLGTNLYSYKYEANSDINDILSVEIKDSYGQIQSISYNVSVFSKPVMNNYNILFTRSNPIQVGSFYSCTGTTKSNTSNTITGGAILSKTKIIIKNKLTGNTDTLEFNGVNLQNLLETVSGTVGGTNPTANAALNNCFVNSKYASQLYSIQIQDSDGVWSNILNGTVINQ